MLNQFQLFDTDLPSTRSPRQYTEKDFILVVDALGAEGAKDVFGKNAIEFYKLQKSDINILQRTRDFPR
ncbi:MAG: hypothetical protein QNL62_19300 [Gammaproteobacteria bacterium]|nr:hypothetical protein [Gammaproteobacteria bacterium]